MGIFSALFGSGPKFVEKGKWPDIIYLIHKRLSEERQTFYSACVEILEPVSDSSFLGNGLSRRFELLCITLQLRFSTEIVVSRKYIQKELEYEFVKQLYLPARRLDEHNVLDALIKRYELPGTDGTGIDIERFYSDLASELTKKSLPAVEALLLADVTGLRFALASRVITAASFGDQETVDQIKAKVQ